MIKKYFYFYLQGINNNVYYITGRDDVKGDIHSDSPGLNAYFELGWEIMLTHCDVKERLFNGVINKKTDTIVTCTGREFLYQKDFLNVLNWNYFKELNIPVNEITDLCQDAIGRISTVMPVFNKDIINSYFNFLPLAFYKKIHTLTFYSEISSRYKSSYVCVTFFCEYDRSRACNSVDDISP